MRAASETRSASVPRRIKVQFILLVGVAVLTAIEGFPAVFNRYAPYDDEGFYLLQLRYATARQGPFSHIWSQYGPTYNLFVSAISWTTRIPIDHDGGRIITLIFWAAASLLSGIFVLRATRSFILGAATVLIGFLWLGAITDEPNQPAAIGFIIALGMLLIIQRRSPWKPMNAAFLGALCMALLLVKINLGIYAIAAIVFGVVVTADVNSWLRRVCLVASVILPLIILEHGLSEIHIFLYAVTVEIGVATLIVRARWIEKGRAEVRWQPFAVGGLVALALLLVGGLVQGDGLKAVIEASVIHPLGYTSGGRLFIINMAAVLGASLVALACMALLRIKQSSLLRIAVRTLTLLATFINLFWTVHGVASSPFAIYPPIVWVVVPVLLIGDHESGPNDITVRICLAAFIVFNELQAFPIAGSQTAFATFLSVPATFLIAGDLLQDLRREPSVERSRWFQHREGWLMTAGIAIATLTLFVVASVLQWSSYDGNIPLELPGSHLMRLPPEQVAGLEATVRDVDSRSCTSLVTFPGMLSFYAWTGLSPPRGLVLDDSIGWQHTDQHGAVRKDLRLVRNACLIRNPGVQFFWNIISALPAAPQLLDLLHTKFDVRPRTYDGYVVSQTADG